MTGFETALDWLASNESALSAMVAIIALCGGVYGITRFAIDRFMQGRRRRTVVSNGSSNGPAGLDPHSDPDRHQAVVTAPSAYRKQNGLALDDAAQNDRGDALQRQTQQPFPKRADAGTSPIDQQSSVDSAALPSIHNDHVTLAVMLFEALSNSEDDEFIASGISSEIISLVTPIPDIRVNSRNSAFAWRSGETGFATAGSQVNAGFAVTGSLRRSGDRIRVIAHLTEFGSEAEIWTQTYDRRLEDLFQVQHDIAVSIVGAILGEVKLARSMLTHRIPTYQLDAWGLTQKAYHFWLSSFSIDGMLKATELLRQAIELDPLYADARSALAMLLAQQLTLRICEDYDSVAAEARVLIDEAYRQAPQDIDVLENAGVVWQNLGESMRAVRAFRHCIGLAPLNLIARGYLAMTLAFVGGREGAVEAKQIIADNLDIAPRHPSKPYWIWFQALAEQRLGNHDAVVRLTEESLFSQPGWIYNYYHMANSLCHLGRIDDASRALASAQDINPCLTPSFFVDNVNRITRDKKISSAFVKGLIDAGLAKDVPLPA